MDLCHTKLDSINSQTALVEQIKVEPLDYDHTPMEVIQSCVESQLLRESFSDQAVVSNLNYNTEMSLLRKTANDATLVRTLVINGNKTDLHKNNKKLGYFFCCFLFLI